MNDRDISTIRRRMRPEKNNIGRIRGCYVNDNHTIISEFDQMLGLISDNEAEEILSLLRRSLSGSIGRNLIDIAFTNQQVLDSDEHRLLSALRSSSLGDNDVVKSFFEKTIAALELQGSYFILLANDKYDIFTYDENGDKNESPEMFSYILCAICPIKAAKPSLGYNLSENKFKNIVRDSMIAAPELGFMFPTLESNGANIYNALFYTRDISLSHEGFSKAIFNTEMPLPAAEQTESIANVLSSTVAEGCSLELVQSVQSQLLELTADHKANKEEEPLLLGEKDMGALLRFGGINEDTVSAFSGKIKEDLGENISVPPANIIDIKKFEVRTPDVTIRVSPEHSDLIETRVIDGTKYLLIRADSDIEVNGIKITINE